MNLDEARTILHGPAIDSLGANDYHFARSLLCKDVRWGLSDKQQFWLKKLAARATGQDDAPPAVDIEGERLIAFFDRASQHLKYPKVKLSANGKPLVLSRAGERSKTPGAIQVTDGGPYGDNVWFGRVNRDGTFTAGRACNDAVVKVLRALATDPAGAAAAYGQRFGNCCFCRRHLEDYRSVTVGYGPICAEKYGLPWGEVAEGLSEYSEEDAA